MKIKAGNAALNTSKEEVQGEFIEKFEGEFLKISNVNAMPTFFMSLVSSSNHWMFIGSNGALTAGRKNPEYALFPYYTDDKVMASNCDTGSYTVIRVKEADALSLWIPFSERYSGIYQIERNLYKSIYGSRVYFEEINHTLGLSFTYGWSFSEKFGFVRESILENLTNTGIELDLLDGYRNILPAGVDSGLQNNRSTLANAYKKNELEEKTGLGIFSLSSLIIDRAEPGEALEATTVWSQGLERKAVLTSTLQLEDFINGAEVKSEPFTKAIPGAYFSVADINLSGKESKSWFTVAELNQSTASTFNLINELETNPNLRKRIIKSINSNMRKLQKLVCLADGMQLSANRLLTTRHYANVLFNVMRGGIFGSGYEIEKEDFVNYIQTHNTTVHVNFKDSLDTLPKTFNLKYLMNLVEELNHNDFSRLATEYLPLSFSRRHGDPSRPWNYFTIDVRDETGKRKFNFEGNWRDIFQNWEALSYSFPGFIKGMIYKFLNATTIDGYNPYRITKEGIDWEVIEPNDPWSYIGYWGDHQIIYLQKMLEHARNHFPDEMTSWLTANHFVYADLPYRIKDYASICENPFDTIDFRMDEENRIHDLVEKMGADGKLVQGNPGSPVQVNMTEKLLVLALTKLYNFIPDAGIWLNTQRPEWNDANNALVGNGTSMVTLNYLRRHLVFLKELLGSSSISTVSVRQEVESLFSTMNTVFSNGSYQADEFTPETRRTFTDAIGKAGELYRETSYRKTFNKTAILDVNAISEFLNYAITLLDKSIRNNKREDGLYHAYNLITFTETGIEVDYLYEMLEGQVAALSSGLLSPQEALDVTNALKNSAMFRSNQYSYMLYPDRQLPHFLAKNTLPNNVVENSKLIQALVDHKHKTLAEQDVTGNVHFAKNIANIRDVENELNQLENIPEYTEIVTAERAQIRNAFEAIFNHKAFTGRSGTFYGYEGLGSIYWHMVSKLLLAVKEQLFAAHHLEADKGTIGQLMEHYFEIRAGIGVNKNPKVYGAFPTDPYSHTPGGAGAKQPGMTGQVKEDILSRWGELGLEVKNGELHFNPFMLHREEFLKEAQTFQYVGINEAVAEVEIPSNSLAFTYCQKPIVYVLSNQVGIEVFFNDGSYEKSEELNLSKKQSQQLFKGESHIQKMVVHLPESVFI